MKTKKFLRDKGFLLVLLFINFISFFSFSFYLALIMLTYIKIFDGKYALGLLVFITQIILTILTYLFVRFYYFKVKDKNRFLLIYAILTLIFFLLSFKLFSEIPLDQL